MKKNHITLKYNKQKNLNNTIKQRKNSIKKIFQGKLL